MKAKAMLASKYSGRISRDEVLRIKGRLLASEVDLWRVGEEEKERESLGELWRKRSKLLPKIVKAG